MPFQDLLGKDSQMEFTTQNAKEISQATWKKTHSFLWCEFTAVSLFIVIMLNVCHLYVKPSLCQRPLVRRPLAFKSFGAEKNKGVFGWKYDNLSHIHSGPFCPSITKIVVIPKRIFFVQPWPLENLHYLHFNNKVVILIFCSSLLPKVMLSVCVFLSHKSRK